MAVPMGKNAIKVARAKAARATCFIVASLPALGACLDLTITNVSSRDWLANFACQRSAIGVVAAMATDGLALGTVVRQISR